VRAFYAVIAAMWIAAPAAAEVSLRDTAALEAFLSGNTPCCVIDARSAANRKRAPLADTLPYRTGLKINPTGVVVVIADTDARAIEIGERLTESSKAKEVYAVKGGIATWKAATIAGLLKTRPRSFVIPKNTCEQGTPLQELRIQ
jgi:rhodanese-related sulfurtransferase